MKPLDWVEPRIPLIPEIPDFPEAVYLIDQSGSYYLTADAVGVAGKHGILITASDVTIDMMGFTLRGVPGSLDGIAAGGMLPIAISNVTVRNGTIRDWGGNGVGLASGNYDMLEETLTIGNGGHGALVGENATLRECAAVDNGGRGIVADKASPKLYQCLASGNTGGDGIVLGDNGTCEDCTANNNAGRGIVADKSSPKLYNCSAVGNTGGDGIVLGANATCRDCTATGNNGIGINGKDKSSPKLYGCHAEGNASDGIAVGEEAILEKCTANGNTGRGIVADKSSPKLFGCGAVGNTGGDGIVLGSGAIFEDCTSRNNAGNGVVVREEVPTGGTVSSHRGGAGGAQGAGVISEHNVLDGFVIEPGTTLTNCEALNNGGNGLTVTDNNSPPKTATVVLTGCVARGNGAIGFKMEQAPVNPPSGGAGQEPVADQRVATPAAPATPVAIQVGKTIAGVSVRSARGASLAFQEKWKEWFDNCVAEENVGDGFSLDGEWLLSQCVSRNNGGVGINSFSFGIGKEIDAEGNGSDGFHLTGGYRLTDCTARGNGGVGIHVTDDNRPAKGDGLVAEGNTLDGIVIGAGSTLSNCTASNNGGHGVTTIDRDRDYDLVLGTLAEGNGLNGIQIGSRSEARNCTARNNGGNGISQVDRDGDGIWESTSEGNGLNGIVIRSGSVVRNCTARSNGLLAGPGGGSGILVLGEANRIERNNISGNQRGIDVDGAGNIIVNNTAMNNSAANYDIATGNSYGPILNVGAGGDLSTLSGGDQPTANVSLTCPTWYADSDGDGYGSVGASQQGCAQPSGYISDNTDCDDTNASVHPGATEVCNGIDDDCDLAIDEDYQTLCEPPCKYCCQGTCIDICIDPSNCGDCGVVCPGPTNCVNGSCQ